MILGINSVSHIWHVVEYSCVLIFMKKRKEGKQKGRKLKLLLVLPLEKKLLYKTYVRHSGR